MTTQQLVTFLLVTVAHCTLIRKCCPHGESFNGSEVCEKSNNTDWILSDNFVIQSSQSTLKIPKDPAAAIQEIYKGKIEIGFPECDKSFSDVITMWKDLSLTKRFYLLHDTTKSQVLLNFHRTSARHDNATLSFSKIFKPESYCIDGGTRDSFVVNLCPCSSATCIRKCCYENEVFDQITNECVDINNIKLATTYEDWTPRFEVSVYFYFDASLLFSLVVYVIVQKNMSGNLTRLNAIHTVIRVFFLLNVSLKRTNERS